jgi:hypothetical protein
MMKYYTIRFNEILFLDVMKFDVRDFKSIGSTFYKIKVNIRFTTKTPKDKMSKMLRCRY